MATSPISVSSRTRLIHALRREASAYSLVQIACCIVVIAEQSENSHGIQRPTVLELCSMPSAKISIFLEKSLQAPQRPPIQAHTVVQSPSSAARQARPACSPSQTRPRRRTHPLLGKRRRAHERCSTSAWAHLTVAGWTAPMCW